MHLRRVRNLTCPALAIAVLSVVSVITGGCIYETQIKEGISWQLVESVNVDQHSRVIEYGATRFRGDRMELEFENMV